MIYFGAGSLREEPKEVYFRRFLDSVPDASSIKQSRTESDDQNAIGPSVPKQSTAIESPPPPSLTTANVVTAAGLLLQHNFHDFNGRHSEDSHSDVSELSELSDTIVGNASATATSNSGHRLRHSSSSRVDPAPNGDVSKRGGNTVRDERWSEVGRIPVLDTLSATKVFRATYLLGPCYRI
jgi:hypothetical protein